MPDPWLDGTPAQRQALVDAAEADIIRLGGSVRLPHPDVNNEDEPRLVAYGGLFSFRATTVAYRSYFIRPTRSEYHWEQSPRPSSDQYIEALMITQGSSTATGNAPLVSTIKPDGSVQYTPLAADSAVTGAKSLFSTASGTGGIGLGGGFSLQWPNILPWLIAAAVAAWLLTRRK